MNDAREVRRVALDDPEAKALVDSMAAYLAELYREDGRRRPSKVHAEHFEPPSGTFLVVWDEGEAVACGGVRPCEVGPGIGELKRVWVEPHARGRGLARLLLARLEDEARVLGYSEVYLDTGPLQHEAMRLYETSGYRTIANYGANAKSTFRRSYAKSLA
jgi:GNAT superfamily N-acetyltransferase